MSTAADDKLREILKIWAYWSFGGGNEDSMDNYDKVPDNLIDKIKQAILTDLLGLKKSYLESGKLELIDIEAIPVTELVKYFGGKP